MSSPLCCKFLIDNIDYSTPFSYSEHILQKKFVYPILFMEIYQKEMAWFFADICI